MALARDDDATVTVAPFPVQAEAAAVEKLETLGGVGISTTVAVLEVITVVQPVPV